MKSLCCRRSNRLHRHHPRHHRRHHLLHRRRGMAPKVRTLLCQDYIYRPRSNQGSRTPHAKSSSTGRYRMDSLDQADQWRRLDRSPHTRNGLATADSLYHLPAGPVRASGPGWRSTCGKVSSRARSPRRAGPSPGTVEYSCVSNAGARCLSALSPVPSRPPSQGRDKSRAIRMV